MGTLPLYRHTPNICFAHSSNRGLKLIAYAKKASRKNRRQQQEQAEEVVDATSTRIVIETLEQGLPQAPSPSDRASRFQAASPGEIYPVFAPKPGTDAPWRWDDDGDGSRLGRGDDDASTSEPSDVPRWNPHTGFTITREQLAAQAEAAAAAAAAAESAAASTSGSAASGASRTSVPSTPGASPLGSQGQSGRLVSPAVVEVSLTVPAPVPPGAAAAGGDGPPPAPLPPASRNAVLSSALGTGFWMAVFAVFVRNWASLNAPTAMGTDPAAVALLLDWPAGFDSAVQVGVALAAAAAVTSSRLALMSVWGELREATDRSNQQILTNLGPFGILVIALASGVPEELLFRGALVPATFPDWRGAAIAAAIFGALHLSGGRNPAFALWAGGVGALYGAAFLCTGNVWVPAAAHVAANAASAFVWKARTAEARAAAEAAAAAAAEAARAAARAAAAGGDAGEGKEKGFASGARRKPSGGQDEAGRR